MRGGEAGEVRGMRKIDLENSDTSESPLVASGSINEPKAIALGPLCTLPSLFDSVIVNDCQ